jgi:hypothetical protein
MDYCARLNNMGASKLVTGMYADAVDSFTRSLGIAKTALAVLAETKSQHNCSSCALQEQQRCAVAHFQDNTASIATPEAKVHRVVDDLGNGALQCLYLSPLHLSESAAYQRYEPTVEASVAIIFNLALAHHLNALYGPFNLFVSTLQHALALYELAYFVQIQEDAELGIEFTMAIINNLGHIHRLLGDEEKGSQCFRHLLSIILFLQSCGERNINVISHADTFVSSVSHLIVRETTAAAA